MTTPGRLHRARERFGQHAWEEAFTAFHAADDEQPLGIEDLERLAMSAYLTGRDDECLDLLLRAHRGALQAGDHVAAARSGFWSGMIHINRGEMAPGSGWLARAETLLDDGDHDCVERGYIRIPAALQTLESGEPGQAGAMFAEAAEVAARFQDADLMAFATLGQGVARVRMGNTASGVRLLDQAMVSVTSDEVSPLVAGIVYCAVIEICKQLFDLRRAREWTMALTAWCESQPDLVPYRGQCLAFRAEVMQWNGDWPEATQEARAAIERLAGHPAVGDAHYQMAELCRLRGDFVAAEEHYREASAAGHALEPGLALLRLAHGRTGGAAASIRRALGEADDPLRRARLLPACVEILLAVDDLSGARAAAEELDSLASSDDVPALRALAWQAAGAVTLAGGDARHALTLLRRAHQVWRDLAVPYEVARVRLLVGLACRELGDEDTAVLELDAACASFRELGAVTDAARAERARGQRDDAPPGGLTAREIEILRLVAKGKTNRDIAIELVISEKTVARHISNVLAKLGLASRAAATAYAYEHDLL